MSRIGKKPIPVPEKVEVYVDGQVIRIRGAKGSLEKTMPETITVAREGNQLIVSRCSDERTQRALHGLWRSLVNNMVVGVSTGFTKDLLINGVGYRANLKGNTLVLALGFSHPIEYPIPEGIEIKVEKQVEITVAGIDKEKVGQTAAEIRFFRPVEPYKGKGIRYRDERVRRKVGKVGV
ncbi:50S ribosomal protein L6 [bacterium]|nr:50S ribosomal protein L6 [candidate division CSSED10-310 bacterium]